MWISKVELHNIKSYSARTAIELVPGINAVCGQNGAGKSTILEAIGLALFGQSTYRNQEQLINNKAKRGEIVVTVVDSQDEREYQVVRPIKGGQPYVFDPETNRQLANGVEDVQRWLRDTIGVEPATDLKALFENAVGVPQGMLTSAFNLTGANRQKIFDPLLGVEEYKKVWDNMRAVVNSIKDQQSDNATAQAKLEGKQEDLPALRADAASLQEYIEATETELRQTTASLAELTAKLVALQQQHDALKGLEQRVAALAERRDNLTSQLQSAEAALTEARQANKKVEQNRAGYETYEQAQQTQQSLEADRKKRDDIQRQLNQCQNTFDLADQALKGMEQQLKTVAQAEVRLVELEPLVLEQERLEAQKQAADQRVTELRASEKRLADETQRLAGLHTDRAQVQTQLRQRQEKTEQISERQRQAEALASDIAAQAEALAEVERQLEATRQSLQAAQECLNTLQTLKKQARENEQLLAQRQTELAEVVADLARRQELEESLAAIQHTRQQRKNELAGIEAQLSEQETGRQQTQLSLTDWQAQAQTLTNLQETDPLAISQLEQIVQRAGAEKAREFLQETLKIEAAGGLRVRDGGRRRSPGGVYFYLARGKLPVKDRWAIWPHLSPKLKPPKPQPMAWAARLEIVPELLAQAKEIKSVKITLIGRPGRIVEKGEVVLTSMQQGGNPPSLPRGLPPVPEEPTVYIVYIARKQWRKVANAIRNPEDVLIVEGLPVLDKRLGTVAVFAQSVTTKNKKAGKAGLFIFGGALAGKNIRVV